MKQIRVFFLAILLIVSSMPLDVFAQQNEREKSEHENQQMIIVENDSDKAYLYESIEDEVTLIELPSETIVRLIDLETGEEKNHHLIYIQVELKDQEGNITLYEGYVEEQYLYTIEEAEAILQGQANNDEEVQEEKREAIDEEISENLPEEASDMQAIEEQINIEKKHANKKRTIEQEVIKGYANKNKTKVYEDPDKGTGVIHTYQKGYPLTYETYKSDWYTITVKVDGKRLKGYIHTSDVTTDIPQIKGYAKNADAKLHTKRSKKSTVLKTYKKGTAITYTYHNKNWYKLVANINGKSQTGYIHKNEVTTTAPKVKRHTIKSPTKVYTKRSRKSDTLKTFKKGSIVNVRHSSKNWYRITTKVNGENKRGYIHKKDLSTKAPTVTRHAIKSPTKIHTKRSRKSKVIKTYKKASVLKVKHSSKNWYRVTVKVNGKNRTGYVHKKDVSSKAQKVKRHTIASPTKVYTKRSRNSDTLKTYRKATVVTVRYASKNWYKITTKVKGKNRTGYIHKKDLSTKAPTVTRHAIKSPTKIHTKRSRKSKVIKTYKKASILKVKHSSKNWYRVTVKVNGKNRTGYVHKKDVSTKAPKITRYVKQNGTKIFTKRSRKGQVLKSYSKGQKLRVSHSSKNWYKITVKVKGKNRTGYIHKSDVTTISNITFVNPLKTYTYNHMVADIKSLKRTYPDLIDYKVIGKSEYGRDIYAVKLGKGKATTFINGSLHAREWITTNLNMYMMENYAKAYRTKRSIKGYNARSILNNTSIWFIPMVNPDGVTLQQQGLSAFPRKDHSFLIRANEGSRNFKRWKANAKGVDLNRNFSVHWKTQSTSKGPHHQNYRGPKSLSAKETRAMVKLVKDIRPQMTINYHSSGEVIYWKYRQSPANMNRDYRYARTIGNMTGYTLMESHNGRKESISGGGFLQYFTGTYRLPSITPELAPYAGNTNVSPTRQFNRIWSKNQAVGLYAAQESAKLYRK